MMAGGITNLIGSSIPACCGSQKGQNIAFGVTGIISLVLRIIAVIWLTIVLAAWQDAIDDAVDCKDEQDKAECTDDYLYTIDDQTICDEDCEVDCFFGECQNNKSFISLVHYIIIILAIWCVVSIVSIIFGFRACAAEGNADANQTVSPTAAIEQVPVTQPVTSVPVTSVTVVSQPQVPEAAAYVQNEK